MRKALGRVAVCCLLFQAAGIVSAEALLWASAANNALACQCQHGDQGMCPMHHAQSTNSKRCVWRGTGNHDDAALTSLVGVTGAMSSRTELIRPQGGEPAAVKPSARPTVHSTPPDAPPPRS